MWPALSQRPQKRTACRRRRPPITGLENFVMPAIRRIESRCRIRVTRLNRSVTSLTSVLPLLHLRASLTTPDAVEGRPAYLRGPDLHLQGADRYLLFVHAAPHGALPFLYFSRLVLFLELVYFRLVGNFLPSATP